MPKVQCPAGRATAIEMLKIMIGELEAGTWDSAFTSTRGKQVFTSCNVNCARGDEIGARGIRVLVQVAPFGEVFSG